MFPKDCASSPLTCPQAVLTMAGTANWFNDSLAEMKTYCFTLAWVQGSDFNIASLHYSLCALYVLQLKMCLQLSLHISEESEPDKERKKENAQ